jgi:DinB superfamily
MATREEYARLPLARRLSRMRSTADELATPLRNRDARALARRPDVKSWSPVEIVCHLRDIEELAMMRFRTMLAMNEPKVLVAGVRPPKPEEWGLVDAEIPVDPERWAEERQYLRCDASAALAAFRRRRQESLDFLDRLTCPRPQTLTRRKEENRCR